MSGRGPIVRRVLVGVVAVLAVVLVALGLRAPDTAAATSAGNALGTPLWSVRRLPQPVIDAVGAQHLQGTLAARTGATAQSCTLVRDDTTQADVTASGAADPLAPGSTMKLLTATAAVAALGADFHFTTDAVAPRAVENGALARLYLVGGGDPLLTTPERIAADQRDPETAGLPTSPLAELADRIVAAGVRSIPGGIVGVDDRYDRTRFLPAWPAEDRSEIGPIGALTVNDGRAGPAGTGAAVDDPAVNAASELARLLVARGVAVGPASRADHAPAGTVRIASLDSPPLPKVLEEMLSASDNLSAEMLTRELGAKAGEGSTARGVQAIRDELTKLHVDLTGASFVDGSGLAHTDRVSCPTLLSVLGLDARPRFAPVADGLAIAGKRGTLALSLRGTPLDGNLRAKTGTLSGVSGLAGYVRSDRPLTFALLLGGAFAQSTGYALREQMASDIAAYPAVADAATLVPGPFAPIPARACRGRGTCVLNPRVPESSSRSSARRPAPIPVAIAELWELVLAYLKQETTEPLKSLWRVIAFGIAGSLLIGIGVVFVAIGGLRLLQDETDAFHGNWSFVPYVLMILLLFGMAALVFWRGTRTKETST